MTLSIATLEGENGSNERAKITIMKYGLLVTLAVLISCTSETFDEDQIELEGKWISVSTKTDTLTFERFGDGNWMILGRGKQMNNGFLLPKSGSGPYDYELLGGDKISLRWTLSSNAAFNEFYFKQAGNKITIEKFFDNPTSGTLITFKKIR
jgi:hypothetical protein